MTPAVAGHPGGAALRFDNPKRDFALTVVRTLSSYVCMFACV